MKKSSLLLMNSLIALAVSAQTPQTFNYQAIARNSSGQIIPSQNIGIRFTITDATSNTIFYQETHNTITSAFGLFTLGIGKGTAVSGSVPSIDWSAGGDKYLKVEIAPQAGTNYTIQGTSQLLSVPYALYAEKTRLIGGTAITITNGNTINSNYQAGPGIAIAGNTISATAANSWLLTGNAGTTSTNFLGTTDNQPLRLRVNNLNRITVETPIATPSGDVGITNFSDFNSITTMPGQISIFGRDVPGVSMNLHLYNSVQGLNWAPQPGNNTMGRIIRISQYTSNNMSLGEYFDFGMDQGKSFFISEHGIQNAGSTFFKKMFTISPQDFVGINFDWGQNPKSRLHVHDGDIYVDQIGSGVIMKSPDGQCWRMTVSNTGTPVFTTITCP